MRRVIVPVEKSSEGKNLSQEERLRRGDWPRVQACIKDLRSPELTLARSVLGCSQETLEMVVAFMSGMKGSGMVDPAELDALVEAFRLATEVAEMKADWERENV